MPAAARLPHFCLLRHSRNPALSGGRPGMQEGVRRGTPARCFGRGGGSSAAVTGRSRRRCSRRRQLRREAQAPMPPARRSPLIPAPSREQDPPWFSRAGNAAVKPQGPDWPVRKLRVEPEPCNAALEAASADPGRLPGRHGAECISPDGRRRPTPPGQARRPARIPLHRRNGMALGA